MFEPLKKQLWKILQGKDVSLAMVYDKCGDILWHKGRPIRGKSVNKGEGFCKSYIINSIRGTGPIDGTNAITFSAGSLSKSARSLLIKSVLIIPLDLDYFLYIDSGTRDSFGEAECQIFKVLGNMMKDVIRKILQNGSRPDPVCNENGKTRKLNQLVLKYSLEEDPILLLGETGVGKSHIAEQIHTYSGRTGPFVVADVTTVNENLFESHIFGHKKGAFTGAFSDNKGLIAEARGGTLFFDEIAEVPCSFQAKLLRFIETRKYRVLGETTESEADVKIITATNVDLKTALESGDFREDLYYRLNVLQIRIPPLRERKTELKQIVMEKQSFLKGKQIGDGFWEAISEHHWPGNFRELFTVLKRAGILCASPITGNNIRAVIAEENDHSRQTGVESTAEHVWKSIRTGKCFWETVKTPFLERDLNRSQVKYIISRALAEAGGKYKDVLPILNLEPQDYKRLLKFLNKNRLQ